MKEGDVVLTPIAQADGLVKPRPVLVLRELPPHGDFLVCGISKQIHQAVLGFDEVLTRSDSDFPASGLVADSVIRLGFLAVLPRTRIVGTIGSVSVTRHETLLLRLSSHLVEKMKKTAKSMQTDEEHTPAESEGS